MLLWILLAWVISGIIAVVLIFIMVNPDLSNGISFMDIITIIFTTLLGFCLLVIVVIFMLIKFNIINNVINLLRPIHKFLIKKRFGAKK